MKKKQLIKRKSETKDRIRDIAIDLFSKRGYNGVSMRDIARSVKIHESSIYSHYSGKEDIMDSIISFLINEFKPETDNIPLEDLLDKYDPEMIVKNAISTMIESLKRPHIRKILRLMWIELYHNEKFLDFFKNQYIIPTNVFWSHLFQKMIEKDLIIDYDPNILAREFFNHCIYLFFECFVVNYDENSYELLIDELNEKVSDHIKFIFDMVGKEG